MERRAEGCDADRRATEEIRRLMRSGNNAAWINWRPRFISVDEILSMWERFFRTSGQPDAPSTLNVYINIPICSSFCRYCMYWRLKSDRIDTRKYAARLIRTIEKYRDRFGTIHAENCYVGGGTASILEPSDLAAVTDEFAKTFEVDNERSFEANPASFDEEKLKIVTEAGFNRISLGIQSFDDSVLQTVGRKNPDTDKIGRVIAAARRTGAYVNADLICGMPGQTGESVKNDLAVLTSLEPDYITLYRFIPTWGLNTEPGQNLIGRKFAVEAAESLEQDLWDADIRDEGHPVMIGIERRGIERPFDISRVYTFHDNGFSSLLGIGTGSCSHIYGNAWVCDVTPPDGADLDMQEVFWGSTLDGDDEKLTLQRDRLTRAGIEPSKDMMPCETAETAYELQHDIDKAALLGTSVPPILREGINRRRRLAAAGDPPAASVSRRTRAWFILLELNRPGPISDAVRVTGVSGDSVSFRVDDSENELNVRIQSPDSGQFWFVSRHFGVSYSTGGDELTKHESVLLDQLRELTLRLDP